MLYSYRGSAIEMERVERGENYCESKGRTYDMRQFVSNGLVMAPPDKTVPLTTPPLGQAGASYIFAVNVDHELRFAPDGGHRSTGSPNLVKHETLFHNEAVRAAGEIQFTDGVLVRLNSASGTYHKGKSKLLEDPVYGPVFKAAVLRAIEDAGVEVDKALSEHLRTKVKTG